MAKKKKKKSHFVTYSEKQVAFAESQNFCLRFGKEFMSDEGYFFFTKVEVDKLYEKTLKKLIRIMRTGDNRNKKHALKMIAELIIEPMRLH